MQIDVAAVVARRHDQQHVPPVAVAEPHERVAHPEGLFDPPMTATTTGLPDGVRGVGKKFFFPPPLDFVYLRDTDSAERVRIGKVPTVVQSVR